MTEHAHPPFIFGEVLFDKFEDGQAILGGAPFNVAWHLQGFGLKPVFISRVGKDPLGDKVIATMQAWGMDTQAIQRDDTYPTGTVEVTLKDGQPSFNIVKNVAYDFIDYEVVPKNVIDISPTVLYHGSLIARSGSSAQALTYLCQQGAPIFVDINLRAPWWSEDIVADLLRSANWLKLNERELDALSGSPAENIQGWQTAARQLRLNYGLEAVIVTLGAEGAFSIDNNGLHSMAPVAVNELVDTVGAGDAFSSVVLLGLMQGWFSDITLQRAGEFASTICQQRGATRQDNGLYQGFLKKWLQ